jgi:hypothetical protein
MLERMLKDAVVTYFQVLYQHLYLVIEDSDEGPPSASDRGWNRDLPMRGTVLCSMRMSAFNEMWRQQL